MEELAFWALVIITIVFFMHPEAQRVEMWNHVQGFFSIWCH